jgi:hypothetical protein
LRFLIEVICHKNNGPPKKATEKDKNAAGSRLVGDRSGGAVGGLAYY